MKKMTDQNSDEMKTVVETFIQEETAELIYDNDQLDKWNELVDDLGLRGQKSVVTKEKSPIPFLYMKQGLVNIFQTLCPRKVDASEFSAGTIPVEILDLMALSKREEYFNKIQIWYDEKTPDPVCVGLIWDVVIHNPGTYTTMPDTPKFKNKAAAQKWLTANNVAGDVYDQSWGATHYLIGKWGDVKRPFKELKEMARTRFMEEKWAELRKAIKTAQRELDDLETTAIETFN